ncbi:MAG TPA: phage holin family protein [Actinomycetota bacterium]
MDSAREHPTETTAQEPRIVVVDPTERTPSDRSMVELLRAIGTETATLVRKEAELARQEMIQAVTARLMAAGAAAAAGLMGLFVLAFLALAAAAALDNVMRPWASRLIVAGGFMLIAAAAGLVTLRKIKRPPMKPEETVRTVREDVEWAKAQLKR